MAHSDDATKTLEKAVPTTNTDGNVVRWDLTYSYEKNEYKSEYSQEIHQTEEGEEKFALKAPSAFTKSELVALLPISHWNNVYDSQYESTHPEVEPAAETTDGEFDVSALSD